METTITLEQFMMFCQQIEHFLKAPDNVGSITRKGQSVSIEFERRFPHLKDEVTGTENDPFYNDKNIPNLLNFLGKKIKVSIEL